MKTIVQTILVAMLAATMIAVPVTILGIDDAVAHSDDDGGDDDGGDDDGASPSRGGGGLFSRPSSRDRPTVSKPKKVQQATRKPKPTPARRPVPVRPPERAASQIIAIGLAEDQLAALQGNGYTVLSRSALSARSVSVIRLGVP